LEGADGDNDDDDDDDIHNTKGLLLAGVVNNVVFRLIHVIFFIPFLANSHNGMMKIPKMLLI